jgi:hypothetical protein
MLGPAGHSISAVEVSSVSEVENGEIVKVNRAQVRWPIWHFQTKTKVLLILKPTDIFKVFKFVPLFFFFFIFILLQECANHSTKAIQTLKVPHSHSPSTMPPRGTLTNTTCVCSLLS